MQEETKAPKTPDPERAMTALAWAVERAERGVPPPPAEPGTAPTHPVADSEDFRAASSLYLPDVRRTIDRIIMSRDAEDGLDALLECGALGAMLPEVKAMVGFGDGEWRHKDVWKHTKQVVRQAVPRLEVRWAALLHDIGKVKTRTISPSGEVHFFGHAEVGARMFDRLDRRLPIFNPEPALKSSVRFLILHHLRASQYEASWTDSAVRRFAKEMGDQLQDLLDLSRADITTKRPEKKKKGLRQISDLADRVEQIPEARRRRAPTAERHRRRDDARLRSAALAQDRRAEEGARSSHRQRRGAVARVCRRIPRVLARQRGAVRAVGGAPRRGFTPDPSRGYPPLHPDQGQPWTSGHRLRFAQSMRGNCL
ncbi:MAG TPA: HD domain-containing protein [Polyangium sp.]|nr:HD domain-containing protein [Polyangium sp.]